MASVVSVRIAIFTGRLPEAEVVRENLIVWNKVSVAAVDRGLEGGVGEVLRYAFTEPEHRVGL